jgi:hypothetical protein
VDDDAPRKPKRDGRDVVALILAVGLATALNVIALGLVWVGVANSGHVFPLQGAGGIPENSTQILTLVFGGIIGVLGGYVGAGEKKGKKKDGEQ